MPRTRVAIVSSCAPARVADSRAAATNKTFRNFDNDAPLASFPRTLTASHYFITTAREFAALFTRLRRPFGPRHRAPTEAKSSDA